jgi:DNA ligase-associated metallophosphoesterase
MSDLPIQLAQERVTLLPERALYWPRTRTLLVADPHWGKASAFRAAAIAIPAGTTASGLARLTQALKRTKAERVIFLGDFLHARESRARATLNALDAWRDAHRRLDITLVRGNHDRRAGDPPAEWRIRCVDPPHIEAPFVLVHLPGESAEGYTLAGHVHPAVTLRGSGGQSTTLSCFAFGPRGGMLPAFGNFTGQARLLRTPGDRLYAIAGDDVLAVPPK